MKKSMPAMIKTPASPKPMPGKPLSSPAYDAGQKKTSASEGSTKAGYCGK